MAGADQKIVQIAVEELQANPLQPRGQITPESLVDLVDSIKQHGVLEPLVVAKTPAGYQIIAGERRWRASRIAGLETVPVVIKETTPQGMLEMALVENVQRTDLNPLERAQAFERLMNEFHLTNKEIAKRIGKSAAYISNSLRLLTLPDALKDGLLQSLITEGHARALAAVNDPRLMVEAYKIVLKNSSSVRKTEDLARRMRKVEGNSPTGQRGKKPFVVDDSIDQLMEQMHQALGGGEKIKVKLTRSRAETKILIHLKGDLEATEKTLQRIVKGICI
ncbi:MAG: ParB/RepB/Spo0J family partition protein [Candidatus Pacebacteria bacterium]|nr:ParB/RepB/Spo0J family partition protein [Candidatus Paceibacterota bacterium]